MRRVALLALLVSLVTAAPAAAAPPIKHVWIVVLENKDYADSFGPDTEAPYLARTLTRAGQLLPNYFGTSHASLGNYITMVSGQAANPVTQGDCLRFVDVQPGIQGADGQTFGQGCVYPTATRTVANQLDERGLSWRGYMEDMGNTPSSPATCRHPAINGNDDTQAARESDQYAARHNPFVYFHSIIDSPVCDRNVVPLNRLLTDVKRPETTPNFAFITPDLCNDGHDETCVDGGPGGLPAADLFLRKWVPRILASPGFGSSGLLIVTWDEANIGEGESSAACCGEPTGPNTLIPGIVGPGGGRTGTVLISPYVRASSVNTRPYNHYGLLRSIEDIFGLPHLGYAGQAGLAAFGADVFNGSGVAPRAKPRACRATRRGRPIRALRLRGNLLSFRTRRRSRVVIRSRLRSGRLVRRRRPTRLRACRTYQLRLPRTVVRAGLRIGKRSYRVKRTRSGEHG